MGEKEKLAFFYFYIRFTFSFSDSNDGFENSTWNVNMMFPCRTLKKELITKPFSVEYLLTEKGNHSISEFILRVLVEQLQLAEKKSWLFANGEANRF